MNRATRAHRVGISRWASRSLVVLFAALGGCSACDHEEEIASFDEGPLAARIVAGSRFTSSGRLPGFVGYSGLAIERGDESLGVSTPCSEDGAEIAGDGTTARLAFRCAPGETWHVVYLAEETAFSLCGDAAGDADRPDFDAVPTDFAASLSAFAECAAEQNPADQQALLSEIGRLGDEPMANFLFESRRVNLWDWEEQAAALPDAERARLAERMRPSLDEDASRDLAACRAIGLLPEDDPAIRRVAVSRLGEIVTLDRYGDVASSRGEAVCAPHLALLLRLSAQTDPELAAAHACDLFEKGRLVEQVGDFRRPEPAFDAAMDALTGHDCDAIATELSALRCEQVLRCGEDDPCTEEEVREALSGEVESAERHLSLRLLAHAYAQRAVPEEVALGAERRTYTVTREPPGTCADFPDEVIVGKAVCDRITHPMVPARCALTIDDAARTIRVQN